MGSGTFYDAWGPTNTATDSSSRYHQNHLKVTWSSDNEKVIYTINAYARSGNGTGYHYMSDYGVKVTLYYSLNGGSWQSLGSAYGTLNYNDNVANITKTVTINRTHSSQKIKFAADNTGNYLNSVSHQTENDSMGAKASYTIAYDGNKPSNATNTVIKVPSSQVKWYGETLALSSTKPTLADDTISTYTITYDTQGGNSIASVTTKKQRKYTLNSTYPWNTAKDGSGTKYGSGANYTSNAATTLYAQWNSSESGGTVTLPTPSRSNYTFGGWYTAANGGGTKAGNAGATYTPSKNITLYAKWTANNYTITLNKNGGTGSITTSYTRAVNSSVTLPSTGLTKTGYNLIGWRTPSGEQVGYSYKGSADITLYAVWEEQTFQVTYTAASGWTLPTTSQTKKYFSNLTLAGKATKTSTTTSRTLTYKYNYTGTGAPADTFVSATATTSYIFNYWKNKNDSTQTYANGQTYSANADITLTASVTSITTYGTVTLTNASRTGYQFGGWATTSTGNTPNIGTPNSSYTLSATTTAYGIWSPNQYTIDFDKNDDMATGTMDSMSVYYDYPVNLNPNGYSKTGYHFKEWRDTATGTTGKSATDSGLVGNLTTVNNATVTLYARWDPNNYNIIYNANNGINAPANQTVTYDSIWNISEDEPTRTYYTFKGWSTSSNTDAIVEYETGQLITTPYAVTANTNLYAVWDRNQYTVTFNYNGGDGLIVSTSAYQGETISLSDPITAPTVTAYRIFNFDLNLNSEDYPPTIENNSQTVTIAAVSPIALTGNVSKIFNGWDTSANNGTGKYTSVFPVNNDSFNNGEGIYPSKDSTTTLYAQWTDPTANNGGQSITTILTTPFTIIPQDTTTASSITINNINDIKRNNYSLKGWSLSSKADSNIVIPATATSSFYTLTSPLIQETRTFYAQWEPTTYKIQYNGSYTPSITIDNTIYNLSSVENLPEEQIISLSTATAVISSKIPKVRASTESQSSGYSITYNFQDETTFPQKDYVTYERKFDKWQWTDSHGSTTITSNILPGGNFNTPNWISGNDIITLNAVWKNEVTNGVRLLTPERTGYNFEGWYLEPSYNTLAEPDESNDNYWVAPNTTDTNLYAKWTPYNYVINYEKDNWNEEVPSQEGIYGDLIIITSIEPTKQSIINTYDIDIYSSNIENDNDNSINTDKLNSEKKSSTFAINKSYQFDKWKYQNSYYKKNDIVDTTKLNFIPDSDEPTTMTLNFTAQWIEEINTVENEVFLSFLDSSEDTIFKEWHVYVKEHDQNSDISYRFLESVKGGTSYNLSNNNINSNFIGFVFVPKWVPFSYSVIYNLNGGATTNETSLSAVKIYNQTYTIYPTTSLNVTWPSQTIVSNINLYYNNGTATSTNVTVTTSYLFSTWNTKQDGSGNTYSPNSAYNIDDDVTFYAQKTTSITGGLDISDISPTPPTPTDGYEPTPIWYKDENFNILVQVDENNKYYPTKNESLYAKWVLKECKIQYNSNGGDQETLPNEENIVYGQDFTIPDTIPFRSDYVFTNWNTEEDNSGNSYTAGSTISPVTDSIILYAQWREIKTLTEWLSNWEQMLAKEEGLGKKIIKLNDQTISIPDFFPAIKNITQNNNETNVGYGYKLQLDLINPYNDIDEYSNLEILERTIFIPAKLNNGDYSGTYKIPSNIKIADIEIFDGAQVTIGYKAHMDLNYVNMGFPQSYEVTDEIIGQINDTWSFNQNIGSLIKAKYYAENKEENITYEYVFDSWKEMTFIGTPKAQFEITNFNLNESHIYVADENGILEFSDYPIDNCIVVGIDDTDNLSNSITGTINYKGYIVKKSYI